MNISLDNFKGNNHVKAALTAAFTQNRLPQAIIIQGENGLGKKTLAKLIANIAVCTEDNKPCGFCRACKCVQAGSHPDIKIEEGSGVSGTISVETIRKIIEDAYRKPDMAEMNVYLLFIKNTISQSSQNKLLKLIEEPPGKALFIITVQSAEYLLPTIRSRAWCLTVYPPELEESAKRYLEIVNENNFENPTSYDEAIELAKIHRGNIGAMLEGKSVPVELAIKTAETFYLNDQDAILAMTHTFIKQRDAFGVYLENLRAIFRDALILSEGANSTIGVSPTRSKSLSLKYRKSVLLKLVNLCSDYAALTKRNVNMTLLVTLFCAKMREIISK